MANRTTKDAVTVRGTNPQYLVEKIIRTRIYDSRYWKEFCFALTAELIIDRAVEMRYIGGIYAGNVKPTPFLCLTLKMLQLQPDKEIIIEFLKQEDHKYLRALAAMYIRLTFSSVEIYRYLEPLYNDYRKLRFMNRMGRFELVYFDELVDELLRNERYCDIQLPRLQKRQALEASDDLEMYVSALDEDLEKLSESEEEEDFEKPRLISKRDRSRSRDRSPKRYADERDRDRWRKHSPQPERHRDRSAERERDRERQRKRESRRAERERDDDRSDRRDRGERKESRRKDGKEDEEREIAESNALRAKLGLAPLQR